MAVAKTDKPEVSAVVPEDKPITPVVIAPSLEDVKEAEEVYQLPEDYVEPEEEVVESPKSYVVLAHIIGGLEYIRGQVVSEGDLGGKANAERLLKNRSIAAPDTDKAIVAVREYVIADAAVQRAKERG